MSFYKVVYTIFKVPLRLIYRLHIHGAENIPRREGFILCSNHTSMRDLIAVALAAQRQPRFMAKKEATKVPLIGAFLRSLGAFPVDRSGADVGAIKKAISFIEDGTPVVIFPQGHRYPYVAARKTPVRHGVGLIAYRAKCAVVPMYILTKSGKVKPFRRTDVLIGEPIPYDELGFENGGSAEYRRAAQTVFDRICDLGADGGSALELAARDELGADHVTVEQSADGSTEAAEPTSETPAGPTEGATDSGESAEAGESADSGESAE